MPKQQSIITVAKQGDGYSVDARGGKEMEYLDVVKLAEADSGLKELDYCPSRSDADCDYTWPPEPVPGAPGWSYVKFFRFSAPDVFIGIRTADDGGASEWKWIDP